MIGQLSIVEAGPECDPERSQWLTPPALARELVGLAADLLDSADWHPENQELIPLRVLEPSAGRGNLVRAVLERAPSVFVDAVDIDGRWLDDLAAIGPQVHVEVVDYLARPAPPVLYDLGVCNVPFDGGEEGAHIAKLLDECERIVALLPTRSLHGDARYEQIWHRFDPRRPERDWYIHKERRCRTRPKFGPGGGSDEIILLDLSRERGSCDAGWV